MDTHIKRLRSSLEEYRSCIVTLREWGIVSMIIFKRKHLSIKWGLFAGILVFLAILLLLLFLLQTVYLDDIYSNFIRTFTNGQRKMEAVLLRSSQVISSVIPLNCLPRMENCPRSQPVTETRRVNLLKMRILEMESV